MTQSDWITTIGVIVTIGCTAVSIFQARKAGKASRSANIAKATVQIAAVAERLKSAQEHIRYVAPDRIMLRGYKYNTQLDLISKEFDSALNALPKKGIGSEARIQLTNAQDALNRYRVTTSLNPEITFWTKLQVSTQDAISELTSIITNLGDYNGK